MLLAGEHLLQSRAGVIEARGRHDSDDDDTRSAGGCLCVLRSKALRQQIQTPPSGQTAQSGY